MLSLAPSFLRVLSLALSLSLSFSLSPSLFSLFGMTDTTLLTATNLLVVALMLGLVAYHYVLARSAA